MRVVTVKAIAKELHERGHCLDELYQITIAYATSLHTRRCAVEAKCEAIEQYYRYELDLDKYSWEEDDSQHRSVLLLVLYDLPSSRLLA